MSTRDLALNPQHNILVNPGQEFNERGGSGYGSAVNTSTFTLDGWLLFRGGQITSPQVSQIDSTIGTPGKSAQLTYTHVAGAGNEAQYFARVPRWQQLVGRQVTLSMLVQCSIVGGCHLRLWDGAGYVDGTPNLTANLPERLILTYTLLAGAAALQAGVRCAVASCTVEVNDCTLTVGPVPADYTPQAEADDLARCLQLYERHGGVVGAIWHYAYALAGNYVGEWVGFAQTKYATPTVTKVGSAWSVANCQQPFLNNPGPEGYMIRTTLLADGGFYFQCSNATDGVTAEVMP